MSPRSTSNDHSVSKPQTRCRYLTRLTQLSIAKPKDVNDASQISIHAATDYLSELMLEDKKIIDMIDGLSSELQVPAFDQAHIGQISSRHSGFTTKVLET